MVDREATPTHYERPLPDEPWRFECPDCGSSAVDSLQKAQIGAGPDEFNFYCQSCSQKLEYIIDKQSDTQIYGWQPDSEDT